jgi:hypothetical protein
MRIAAVSLIGLLLCSAPALEATSQLWHTGPGEPEKREPPEKKQPPEKTIKVTGTVVDRDGNPLAQAQVSFAGPKPGSVSTDSDGTFDFEGPIGDYKITVKIGGKSQLFQAKITNSGLQPSTLEFNKE